MIFGKAQIRGLQVAFLLILVAAYGPLFVNPRFDLLAARSLVLYGLGIVYLVGGCLDDWFFARSATWGRPLYFGLQGGIVAALQWLAPTQGFFAILIMPLISQAIMALSARTAWVFSLALVVNAAATVARFSTAAAIQVGVGIGAGAIFTAVFTVLMMRAEEARRRAEALTAELEAANTRLRAYSTQVEELATAQERNRLAREIHDGLGHYLTALIVQLEAARAVLATDPARAAGVLERLQELSREALADVRRSVSALRSAPPGGDLVPALQALAGHDGLAVRVRVEGESRPLAADTRHALYRAAQEGLTNVRKHAGASRAEVVLDFREPSRVQLAVEDDGRGPSGGGLAGGHGLWGLRTRIAELGGTVQAGAGERGGFALRVEVPA